MSLEIFFAHILGLWRDRKLLKRQLVALDQLLGHRVNEVSVLAPRVLRLEPVVEAVEAERLLRPRALDLPATRLERVLVLNEPDGV